MNKVKIINIILISVFVLAFSFITTRTFIPTFAFAEQPTNCGLLATLCGEEIIWYCWDEGSNGPTCLPCGSGC